MKSLRWLVPCAVLAAIAAGVRVLLARPMAASASGEGANACVVEGPDIMVPVAALRRMGFETVSITLQDVPVIVRLAGRTGLDMAHVAHVKAQFPGRIANIGPSLGDEVQGPALAGEPATPLCTIESVDLANAKGTYVKAKVQLALDRDAQRRTSELVATQVLAEKSLLDAQSAVTKDDADLESARQSLLVFGLSKEEVDRVDQQEGRERMLYTIQSPSSGIVAEKNVTQGELADPSVNLYTIADTSTLWVWGDVHERDWEKIAVGQKIRVQLAAFPTLPLECRIEFISPQLDASVRSIRIRGTINNPDRRFLADMYGTLLVTVNDGKNSIVLPVEAIVQRLQNNYVFMKLPTSGDRGVQRFERRDVAIETIDHDRVRVTKGLAAGDVVVTHGALALLQEMER